MEKETPDELFEKELVKEYENEKLFKDEETEDDREKKLEPSAPLETWKILIVDDEEDIHAVTKMVLKPYTFMGRTIDFLDAYSAKETIPILESHTDIALILLDVVMETNNAGLDLVKYIRQDMGNSFTQIILRTAHPGQAPERDVIRSYEINDYKTKTELTALKLFTSVLASIRSYASITEIESYRQSLEEKVLARTREIKKKNQTITDSIYYARRIQNALLPLNEDLDRLLPSYFIINKPKDIVSGDYYWLAQKNNMVVIAVADCTGHGVPGAFMSILGVAFLNEIVNKADTIRTDEILNQLRSQVIKSLHQTEKDYEAKDGMEIALCMIDFETKKLQYSGAFRPLYLIRDNELNESKGDNLPIGIYDNTESSFSQKELIFKENDTIYMFSDGYLDQLGGPKRKTFRSKYFKELLIDIHHKPMQEQKILLEKKYDEWKGDIEQIDDILVMGIKM